MPIWIKLIKAKRTECVFMVDGLIRITSNYGFDKTLSNAIEFIKMHDIEIFSLIDHKKNADGVAMDLNNATVIIFGDPKAGTKLMQDKASIAIDLPLRLLISEEDGKVYIRYYNPLYIAKMHKLDKNLETINKISGMLNTLAMSAAGKD